MDDLFQGLMELVFHGLPRWAQMVLFAVGLAFALTLLAKVVGVL